ncbi:hypothetical protein [Kitasatospora sp. NBC_01300]|uniref:hypothetical protein n=1 Tax=Kitasatospora sp. NBC_01300 TaxID=2903574 RepID=UPI002F919543|nr:hypothetical protein OG556_35405 [Kitasatospora sp. NBC_01300]
MVTGEWRTHVTAFSMGESTTRTIMGSPVATPDSTIAALHFSTGITREFHSPLLDRLVPMIVITLLVFASLFVVTTDSDRCSPGGWSEAGGLGEESADPHRDDLVADSLTVGRERCEIAAPMAGMPCCPCHKVANHPDE